VAKLQRWNAPKCSFCGKTADTVAKMVAGSGVCICNECVDLCHDIIATDTSGRGLRRLTQHEGANTYAACSPDGRLISFFSTGKRGAGAGLFIMPIQRPWLAKKISSEVGESLRWEALPPVGTK